MILYTRFIEKILKGQKVVVLYFGDHDPSGLDMVRDIKERIEFMMSSGKYSHKLLSLMTSRDISDIMLNGENDDLYDKFRYYYDKGQTDNPEYRNVFINVVVRNFFRVKHIGLTREQVKFYNLPPNPAKLSYPRAKKYVEKFGDISWEVDALQPREIEGIIRKELSELIDYDKYNGIIQKEDEDKKLLRSFIEYRQN